MRVLLGVGLIAVLLVGCSGQALAPGTPRPTVDPSLLYGANDTPTPPDESSAAPLDNSSTAPADNGPSTEKVGDVVTITCNGTDCETVEIDKIQTAKFYRDPQGYLNDTPQTKGDVFMAFHVIYKAIGPDADYNPFDWAVYVNDTVDQTTSFVEHGPKPELESGNLPNGKTASGWIVQEIPASGRVVISYQPGQTDIFEVVARSK